MSIWKPSVTVAAVVERDGRFLLVEEHTRMACDSISPPAISILAKACCRRSVVNARRDCAPVEPALRGHLHESLRQPGRWHDVTYMRFAFVCDLLGEERWSCTGRGDRADPLAERRRGARARCNASHARS